MEHCGQVSNGLSHLQYRINALVQPNVSLTTLALFYGNCFCVIYILNFSADFYVLKGWTTARIWIAQNNILLENT